MSLFERSRAWDLDLDRYLNRVIPPSPLHKFPAPISRFLGYRKTQRQDVGNVLGAIWSLLGAFCGLGVIAAVFNNTPSIQRHSPPVLIASFVSLADPILLAIGMAAHERVKGASAILEYNAVRSPLGQPRNALLGHTFSALIGVGISRLFQLHPEYESIKWIAGALSCGIASAVMLLTGTVHPPGGASAVLAAVEPSITSMGWYFVPLVMWGTILALVVGLIINNIQRQFPVYWWTPLDIRRVKRTDEETLSDAKGAVERKENVEAQRYDQQGQVIHITGAEVILPEDLSLDEDETRVLKRLRERIRKRVDAHSDEESEELKSKSGRSSTEFTMVP